MNDDDFQAIYDEAVDADWAHADMLYRKAETHLTDKQRQQLLLVVQRKQQEHD